MSKFYTRFWECFVRKTFSEILERTKQLCCFLVSPWLKRCRKKRLSLYPFDAKLWRIVSERIHEKSCHLYGTHHLRSGPGMMMMSFDYSLLMHRKYEIPCHCTLLSGKRQEVFLTVHPIGDGGLNGYRQSGYFVKSFCRHQCSCTVCILKCRNVLRYGHRIFGSEKRRHHWESGWHRSFHGGSWLPPAFLYVLPPGE